MELNNVYDIIQTNTPGGIRFRAMSAGQLEHSFDLSMSNAAGYIGITRTA